MVGNAYCLKSLHGVRGSYAKEWTFGTFVSPKPNVKIINSLKNDKVDTTYIQTSKGATGVALITVDKNAQNSIVVSPGANFEVKEDDIDNNIEAIKNSDIVVLQLETPLNTIKYALNKAKELNKYTILNPAPAVKLDDEIIKNVDCIYTQ